MGSCCAPYLRVTYEWKTAVRAPANLRLVHVDEDLWVSERSTPAVTRDHALVRPADGLLVDELDGGIGTGLSYMQSVELNCSYASPSTSSLPDPLQPF
jgi:hypothetical protein